MLADEFNDFSVKYDIEDYDYMPSDGDDGISVTVPTPDISDKEAQNYKIITE